MNPDAATAAASRTGTATSSSLAESVPPADIAALDRVINVYPGLDRLAGLSAERAQRLYGPVYPRHAHREAEPHRTLAPNSSIRSTRSSGLFARTVSTPTSLEESDACGRLIIASLCVPPAR